jgi:hypothetical protein
MQRGKTFQDFVRRRSLWSNRPRHNLASLRATHPILMLHEAGGAEDISIYQCAQRFPGRITVRNIILRALITRRTRCHYLRDLTARVGGKPYQRLGRRSGRGFAGFTVSLLPPSSFSLRALIASFPPLVISTNPKPRSRPVSRSVIRLTFSTVPYAPKSS